MADARNACRMKKPHQQLARREQTFYSKFLYIWCLPVRCIPARARYLALFSHMPAPAHHAANLLHAHIF